jgi:uncharacterized protein (DUF433 family)
MERQMSRRIMPYYSNPLQLGFKQICYNQGAIRAAAQWPQWKQRMSKVDYRNIEKVADRCGGRAVVAGTRIRVSLILAWYRQGMTAEQIVEQYPHLRPADVHDALAYAYDHPGEIEADLAADDEAVVQQAMPGGRLGP